jgi:ligand-binding sensor domain-containing protein
MKERYKIIFPAILIVFVMILTSCTETNKDVAIEINNILEENAVNDIVNYKDKLYAGCLEGVFEINPDNFETKKIDNEDIFLVKDLLVHGDKLYIGHDNGITVYDGNNFTKILDETSGVSDIRVNTMMIDSKDTIWAGTYEGVLKKTDNEWEEITTDDGLAFKIVFLIMEDEYGGMIFGHYGSRYDGISYLKDGKWSYFDKDNGLPHNYIVSGMENEDLIYIATGFYDTGGFAVFKPSEEGIGLEYTIIKEWGKYGSKPRSLNIDDAYMWIGTEYNGLCIMEEDEFIVLDMEDGLLDNEVKVTYFDDEGRAWLATKKGISIVKKSEVYSLIH